MTIDKSKGLYDVQQNYINTIPKNSGTGINSKYAAQLLTPDSAQVNILEDIIKLKLIILL